MSDGPMTRDAITLIFFFAGVALASVALLDWLGYSLFIFGTGFS